MKNLDLSVFDKITWQVTLPGGQVLNIKKPTQAELITLGKKAIVIESEKDTFKQMENLSETTLLILNNNMEGLTFTKDQLEKMFNLDMYYAIYFGYMEFVNEIVSNPN